MAINAAMKLAAYLESTAEKPSAFAARIGKAPSTILRLVNGERLPGLELAIQIRDATDGKVQPDDFLPAVCESPRPVPEPAE